MSPPSKKTISETLYDGYAQSFDVRKMIVDEKTAFQHAQIFESAQHGRVFVLDGIIQLTEADEFTYSEMLAHPPITAALAASAQDGAPAVTRALIVGGGDGAVAEEILKHQTVDAVDLVDIDARVVALAKEHLACAHKGVFDDPRLSVHTVDAFDFLANPEAQGRYDLIIADRPDPVGPAEVLFGQRFYERLHIALSPYGFAVFQTGVPIYQPEECREAHTLLAEIFPKAGLYLTVTPTYIGGHMALTWAGKDRDLSSGDLTALTKAWHKANVEADYYTPEIHAASFALPPFIGKLVS